MNLLGVSFIAHALFYGALIGCGAGTPSWVTGSTPFDNDAYVVGIGSCGPAIASIAERRLCASSHALENAVLKIRSKVSAARERRCSMTTRTFTSAEVDSKEKSGQVFCEVESRGRTEAKLDVVNTSPRELSCSTEGECFAIVALSRMELSERIHRRFEPKMADFNELLYRAKSSDLINALTLIERAERMVPALDEDIDLISAIGGTAFASSPSPSPHAELLRVRQGLLNDARLCVRSDTSTLAASTVFRIALDTLTQKGFARVLVGSGSDCSDATIVVTFTVVTATEKPREDLFVTNIGGTVTITTAGNTVAKSKSVNGHGYSRSVEQAKADALEHLTKTIDDAIRELMFGR